MPFYKKKKFVRQAIKSVLSQSYKNFEIILIYDDIIKKDLFFLKKLSFLDTRIKIYNNKKNMGAGYSRNFGIQKSKGSFIAFLDCDDIWHEKKLIKQLTFMKKINNRNFQNS